MPTIEISASQGIVTLASSWRRVDVGGLRPQWSAPTAGSGSLTFPLAALPRNASISSAWVACQMEMQSRGEPTLAGKPLTRAQISIPASARSAGSVSVPITWQAVPDSSVTPVMGNLYTSFCKFSGATLTIAYTQGGGGGGGSPIPDVSQSGGLIHVVSPGRQGRTPMYYDADMRDYSRNGIALRPAEALIEEDANGNFSASLKLPMDEKGAWQRIAYRGVIRLPAPAREAGADRPPQERDQLFRIYEVEPDLQKAQVTVEARHIFYDLAKAVMIGSDANMDKVPVAEALERVSRCADHPLPFRFSTDCEGTVTGDYRGKNIVEALLDPDEGIAAQVDGRLMRDNFDVYLMRAAGKYRGVRVEHGRNCLGASCTYNADAMANRIVARMDDAYSVIDDPERADGEDILTAFRTYKKEDGTAEEQAKKEFEQGLAGADLTMDVNFILLSETASYARYAGLQVLFLWDEVHLTLPQGSFKAQMTGYVYNAITRQYDEMRIGATAAERIRGSVPSYQISGLQSGKLLGQIGGSQIRDGAIDRLKIAEALVTDLQAESIRAVEGNFEEIAANRVGANQIKADAVEARHLSAAALDAVSAHIVEADIDWAKISDLQAAIAEITSAELQHAEIDFARIKDLATDSAIITQGTAGELYISRLAVTEANMVSLSVGQLLVKGEDGGFYALTVDESGNILTERKQIGNDDVTDLSINAGEKLIEGSVTAQTLNARQIFGESALIQSLIAANLDVDTLFAREATIAALNTVDIRGNQYLRLTVQDAVKEMEIGGRNLAPDSEGPIDGSDNPLGSIMLYGDLRGTFTLSADITKEPDDNVYGSCISCKVAYANGLTETFYGERAAEGDERDGITRRKTLTFSTSYPEWQEVSYLELRLLDSEDQFLTGRRARAERIKLERGTVATDWTPDPEDTKAAISAIEQRADSISLRVGLVEEGMAIPPEELVNSSLTLNQQGIEMNTAGHFRLRANDGSGSIIKLGGDDNGANFSVDERGAVSARTGDFAEGLTVGNKEVWTKKNIVISATRPQNAHDVLWIQPQAGVQQTTHSLVNNSQPHFYSGTARIYGLSPDSEDTLSSGGSYEYSLSLRMTLGTDTAYQNRHFTVSGALEGAGGRVTLNGESISLQGWSSAQLTLNGQSAVNLCSFPDSITLSLTVTGEGQGNTFMYIPNGTAMTLTSRNTAADGEDVQMCSVHYIP